jgi:flagellar motor component MotA
LTEPGSDPLSELITLLNEVLIDVRKGRLLALERMTDEFTTLYQRLETEMPTVTDNRLRKTRLKTLSRLRAHLEQEVKEIRGTTLNQLGKVTQGRRSLNAYKSIVSIHERGAKRGEG